MPKLSSAPDTFLDDEQRYEFMPIGAGLWFVLDLNKGGGRHRAAGRFYRVTLAEETCRVQRDPDGSPHVVVWDAPFQAWRCLDCEEYSGRHANTCVHVRLATVARWLLERTLGAVGMGAPPPKT